MSDAGNNKPSAGKRVVGRPFQPGQSGNPNGRPKDTIHVRDLARQWTEQALLTLAEIMQDQDAPKPARVQASEALLDRAWGKAPASYEVTGAGGEALGLVVHLHMDEAKKPGAGDVHD